MSFVRWSSPPLRDDSGEPGHDTEGIVDQRVQGSNVPSFVNYRGSRTFATERDRVSGIKSSVNVQQLLARAVPPGLQLAVKEIADERANLRSMRLQRKMPCVEQMNFRP
jgi:hypothetical protein